MEIWEKEWDGSENGRWTHQLIPEISQWVNRKHGEVNFYLTQFLTGHGCFRKYLHKIGHADSPMCPMCNTTEETPRHVVFECPRFAGERTSWMSTCGSHLRVENIVAEMCNDSKCWEESEKFIRAIMMKLQTST